MLKTASFLLISAGINLLTGVSPQEKNISYKTAPRKNAAASDALTTKFHSIGIRLHPGTDHRKDSRETPKTSRRCKSLVYSTLTNLPKTHTSLVKDLTLFYTNDGRRGLAGASQVILRCLSVEDYELSAVLTHEIGHVADENYIVGDSVSGESGFYDFGKKVYENDPSVRFYRLSWKNERERLENSTRIDFVTGYAMSDPFEDFAEAYLFYRLHGPEFRTLAASNEVLGKKYEFMKEEVFGGQEFELNSASSWQASQRVYDATLVPFDLQGFFKVSPKGDWL